MLTKSPCSIEAFTFTSKGPVLDDEKGAVTAKQNKFTVRGQHPGRRMHEQVATVLCGRPRSVSSRCSVSMSMSVSMSGQSLCQRGRVSQYSFL